MNAFCKSFSIMENNNMTRLDQTSNSNWNIVFLCWLIASISTMGSFFFSAIMQFAPCVGLFSFDKSVVKYALPLALAGWFIAFYHNLLYAGIIPESIQPCSQGVSCTEDYINLFGIFTIPMLSLISFSTIVALLFILKRRLSK